MQKNEELVGVVSSLGCNFEGIVKIDGTVCFVPFCLVGEKVRFKVLKVSGNVAYCKLLEVLTPADNRTRNKCPVFMKCGGCQLQHLKYKEQLKEKSKIVQDCFSKIAGIDVEVPLTYRSINEYHYRNKLQLPVRNTKNGNQIGFFAENSHRLVQINDCPLHDSWIKPIISVFNEFIFKNNISCYNEETKMGVLKHIVARKIDKAIIIVAVINSSVLPHIDNVIDKFKKIFKVFSFYTCVNKEDNNVILTDKITCHYGEPTYIVQEYGLKYPIGPLSFIQVNDSVKGKLYEEVLKNLNIDNDSVVIDAYSGAGLLSGMIALSSKKVYGIEIIKEAVESANELTKLNNLTDRLTNICGDVQEILPTIIEKERNNLKNISIVLDPPRKGCDRSVLDTILKVMPEKIVYVSCSPQSLARDVGILSGSLRYVDNNLVRTGEMPNYEISSIKPYDNFPQTKHIETVVCLTKKH